MKVTNAKIISNVCVNSSWPPDWLLTDSSETCKCGFECKITVAICRNGHPYHTYILTEKEFKSLTL